MSALQYLEAAQGDALITARERMSFAKLRQEADALAIRLKSYSICRVGILGDNDVAWIIADLAAARAGALCAPLSPTLSDEQLRHAIRQAGLEAIICFDAASVRLRKLWPESRLLQVGGHQLVLTGLYSDPMEDVDRIAFHVDDEDMLRGVCLNRQALDAVTASVCASANITAQDRHFCLLPLNSLAEQMAGTGAALAAGAATIMLPAEQCGFGSTIFNPAELYRSLVDYRASTLLITPELLKPLLSYMQSRSLTLEAMRYMTLIGAPASRRLINAARRQGAPVYAGYCLNEAGSMVCLSTPKAYKPGSVGKPLPHSRVRISEEGEVMVSGAQSLGYLGGGPRRPNAQWNSGDLGYMDNEGFLFIRGRKKDVLVTAEGRRISPDWIEAELTGDPQIRQAAVFGAGKSSLVAVIVAEDADELTAVVERVNRRLPEFAQIKAVVGATQAFNVANGLLQSSGRKNREAIQQTYQDDIDAVYELLEATKRMASQKEDSKAGEALS
ncbi:AMP-binding protein [Hahella aquimaris]|uniref:AMP-binding protein n=1 Tax=Hahella sp. HNIBRBA332 TaxID=3015983 RepID=UPI00273CC228|nr:AMP-binding protein [Hahella sp. HNIBRBA332]WLQ13480.1 AMP-binding protein [Hahella sp. HNIBRBA332]